MTGSSKNYKIETNEMDSLLAAVRKSTGIDLSDYAQSSLKRRIARFNELARLDSLNELQHKLRSEKDFADHFINEITVNVTEMFRDPSFWIFIRDKILSELCHKRVIKIWHAGCSMGEEVYTMCILLKEAELLQKAKITASDININAIKIAQSGISKLKNQEVNERNYFRFGGRGKLSDYYKVTDNYVGFNNELYKNVEFKKHDLSSDGHFDFFDLIICRNVFIYFNFNLQEKVLGVFNQSMTKNSFLGIGSKESIAYCKGARLLNVVSAEEKIYRRI